MTRAVTPDIFRAALAQFASGVTVVAAHATHGPLGMTATSFASVALDPPSILVCVNRRAGVHDGLISAQSFGVSVLREDQAALAEQFARPGIDRFAGVDLVDGPVPLIQGAIVSLECRQRDRHASGDHTILIGEVVRIVPGEGQPLVRFDRHFGGFAFARAGF